MATKINDVFFDGNLAPKFDAQRFTAQMLPQQSLGDGHWIAQLLAFERFVAVVEDYAHEV